MSYSPLWTRDAAETRDIIASFTDHPALDAQARDFGDKLRAEFPDVDAELVGWIAVRTLTWMVQARQHEDLTFKEAWYMMLQASGSLVGVQHG